MNQQYSKCNYREGKITEGLNVFIDKRIINNTFILTKNNHALIVDPSFNGDKVIDFLKQNDLKLDGILVTHGHFDHIGESVKILKKFKTKIYLNEADRDVLEKSIKENFADLKQLDLNDLVLFSKSVLPTISVWEEMSALHTPGHTPGSTCYYNGKWVFSGDHIFDVDIGRTDFPYSDERKMQESIKKFVNAFKNKHMIVFPGHEEWTEVDNLKNINGYVGKYF